MKYIRFVLIFYSFLGFHSAAFSCNGTAGFTFPSPFCAGASVEFDNTSTGGANSYTWVWGDGSPNTIVGNGSNQYHTYATTGSYQVSLIRNFTSPVCSDTITLTINIVNSPPPPPTFTFTPNNGCSTTPVDFTNTTGNPALDYSWNFGDPASGGQNTSNNNNPSHEFTGTGSGSTVYTVTLTATNSIGCSSSATANVTVGNRPDAAIADSNMFSPFNNCSFASTTTPSYYISVTNASSTIANNASYTIDWGDGSPVFTAASWTQTNHTYSSLGIFNITVTVTGINGCTDVETYQVVNLSNPSVGLTGPGNTSGCGPQTYQFTLSPDAANLNFTSYTFDFGDGTPPVTWNPPITSNVISHTYTTTSCGQPGNQFTVKVTARNACDSTTATVNNIKVSSKPEADFTASPNPGCVNVPITFINNTVPGCFISGSTGNTSTQFVWDFGDGSPTISTTSTASQSHTYTGTGIYNATLTAINPCGNTTFTYPVRVLAPPLAAFSITPPGCVPVTINTTNMSAVDSLSYNWSVSPAGGWNFSGGTNNTSPNAQFTFNAAGTYTITLVTNNPCGVSIADTVITVKDDPLVTLSPIPDYCGTATITPGAVYNPNGGTISGYSWNFPGGTPVSSGISNPAGILYPGPGNYNVSVTATNECGSATSTQVFDVNPLPPASAGNDTAVCQGESANIGSAPVAGLNYSWSSIPAGYFSSAPNPVVTPSVTTTYVVTVTNAVTGCVERDTVVVTINPLPVVSAGTPQTICIDAAPVNLSGTPAGGTWSGTGITNPAAGTFDPSVSGLGTFAITYSYTDPMGCSASSNVNITVAPLPVVSAGPDLTLCNQPGTTTLAGYSPAGGTWSGNGVTAGGVFDPGIAGVGSHQLVYSFTDPDGCTSTDTILVDVINPTFAVAGINDTICLNNGQILLSGFSPAGGTWTGTGITNPAGTFDPAVSGVGTFTVTYNFGSGTCATTDTKEVVVKSLPVVTAGTNQSLCIDAVPFNLSGNSPSGGWWSGTGITDTAQGTFDPLGAGPGTFIITYTYIDPSSGCGNSATVSITVNALPVVAAGNGFVVCDQPIPVTLSGYSPAGGTWTGNGVSPGGIFDPSSAGVGVHTLTYTFINANGCSDDDTINVNVVAPVIAAAGTDDTLCIDAGQMVLSGFSPASGTWSGTGIVNASGTFDPSVAGPGSHTLTYSYGTGTCLTTDTKNNGCKCTSGCFCRTRFNCLCQCTGV